MAVSSVGFVVDPKRFSKKALHETVQFVRRGGRLDIVVLGVQSNLQAAQAVTLALYEAVSDVNPSEVDVTVLLRTLKKNWEALYSVTPYEGAKILTAADMTDILPIPEPTTVPESFYCVAAVGGTFDHLHYGHKLLLTLAGFIARETLIVGITGPKLLVNKKYAEFLDSYEKREAAVRDFLSYVYPNLHVRTEPINDIYGPTATEPAIDALVVSHETRPGAEQINELRKSKGWKSLDIVEVGLIGGDNKLSSTDLRRRDASSL